VAKEYYNWLSETEVPDEHFYSTLMMIRNIDDLMSPNPGNYIVTQTTFQEMRAQTQ
jgi:hypothetical protein